jgi:hypothetical protein
LIAELRPLLVSEARPCTTSGKYGRGSFPLHTDMAHWPVPPRYLVMRSAGSAAATPTLLVDAKALDLDGRYGPHWRRAVWRVIQVRRPFLCSMHFSIGKTTGLRWDPDAMVPHSSLAEELAIDLSETLERSRHTQATAFTWKQPNNLLIVDNWRIMHARPDVQDADAHRLLQRVVVRGEGT